MEWQMPFHRCTCAVNQSSSQMIGRSLLRGQVGVTSPEASSTLIASTVSFSATGAVYFIVVNPFYVVSDNTSVPIILASAPAAVNPFLKNYTKSHRRISAFVSDFRKPCGRVRQRHCGGGGFCPRHSLSVGAVCLPPPAKAKEAPPRGCFFLLWFSLRSKRLPYRSSS